MYLASTIPYVRACGGRRYLSRARSHPQNRGSLDPGNSNADGPRGSKVPTIPYRILRNRNDRLHPNPRTNFCLSIYTTLVLIPVCCQRQLFFAFYIYPSSLPFANIESSPETTSRSHRLPTTPSHHLHEAFHKHLSTYLNINPRLKAPQSFHSSSCVSAAKPNPNRKPTPHPTPKRDPPIAQRKAFGNAANANTPIALWSHYSTASTVNM